MASPIVVVQIKGGTTKVSSSPRGTATRLVELTDVYSVNIADSQVLTYAAANSRFEFQTQHSNSTPNTAFAGAIQFYNGSTFGATSRFQWDNGNTSLGFGDPITGGTRRLGGVFPAPNYILDIHTNRDASGFPGTFVSNQNTQSSISYELGEQDFGGRYGGFTFYCSNLASEITSPSQTPLTTQLWSGGGPLNLTTYAADGHSPIGFYIWRPADPIEALVGIFEANTGFFGLGNSSPQHRLSVNGSVFIEGTIFANNSPGSPGTVLTSNGSGMNWISVSSNINSNGTILGVVQTSDYGTFEATIAAASAHGNTIFVSNNSSCSSNTTVPANVQLFFVNGGVITISTGVTLTVDSAINEEPHKLFGGSGNVDFGTSLSKKSIPQWFGVVANGVNSDSKDFYRASRALRTGGIFEIPNGTYLLDRGVGGWEPTTNNVTSNTIIKGSGAGTLLKARNGAGVIPNDSGNFFYNIFAAANCTNITIRDLAFEGYGALITALDCSNILVDQIRGSGHLINAGQFLFNMGVYLERCKNTSIINSSFLNFEFSVYLTGIGTGAATQFCEDTKVVGCRFEHTVAANNYTTLFPVGIYDRYANNTTVTHSVFKNIYSSVDNGNQSTGVGYGIFEGDGQSQNLLISHNKFIAEGKGDKKTVGIFISTESQLTLSDNQILVTKGMNYGILVNSQASGGQFRDQYFNIIANQVNREEENTETGTAKGGYGIYISSVYGNSVRADILVSDNEITGNWFVPVWCSYFDQPESFGPAGIGLGTGTVTFQDNLIRGGKGVQLNFLGVDEQSVLIRPVIRGNRLLASNGAGMVFNFTHGAVIENNIILDGNLGDPTDLNGDEGACIVLTSFSHGCRIVDNIMGNSRNPSPNSPQKLGRFKQGISQAHDTTGRIWKDIIHSNQFQGFDGTANQIMYRQHTTTPTTAFLDISAGEIIYNSARGGASPTVEGWICNSTSFVALTANADSVNDVKVASTTGWLAGDGVLLVKANTLYGALVPGWSANTLIYSNAKHWHATTIAVVSNGTNIVLTDAIPAGDGTYQSGVAFIKRARFVQV